MRTINLSYTRLAVLVAVCLVAVLVAGCGGKPGPHYRLSMYVDTSKSAFEPQEGEAAANPETGESAQMLIQRKLVDDLGDAALGEAQVGLYRFAEQVGVVYRGTPLESYDFFGDVKKSVLKSGPDQTNGTYLKPVLEHVLNMLDATGIDENDPSLKMVILVSTDGDLKDLVTGNQRSQEETLALANRLAKHPKFGMLVIAPVITKAGTRQKLEDKLSPIFGQQLLLAGEGDAQFAKDKVVNLMDQLTKEHKYGKGGR